MSKLYELADDLFSLRRQLLPHENTGVCLTADEVRLLTDALFRHGRRATQMGHEISFERWKEIKRRPAQLAAAAIIEARRPDSNVRLLNPKNNTGPDAA